MDRQLAAPMARARVVLAATEVDAAEVDRATVSVTPVLQAGSDAEGGSGLMVSGGVDPGIIDVGYHGANNPIVKTSAGVAEARHRRVEITIR